MESISLKLEGAFLLKPEVFLDKRGYFYESFNEKKFHESVDPNISFVQDNISKSTKGVLRGLHIQKTYPQGKLIRVQKGKIFDVMVDLRPSSNTYKCWQGIFLTCESFEQIWVPPGFAHGFLVLSSYAEIHYKCSEKYSPENELCLLWNDKELAVDWPLDALDKEATILSKKDLLGMSLDELERKLDL
ncbi:dTDP-4-dehydrorhamnose 3,5-epimerase [Gammaproteobacteria bacterium]|nr:dTDP-4-dehydrorhamnose 3,5-epimerase [Gammaproteobacteria bacterium]